MSSSAIFLVGKKLGLYGWAVNTVVRRGVPRMALAHHGGLGDHLLCTAVFHELRKRGKRGLWMLSQYPDLFRNNREVDAVVPPHDPRYQALVKRLGGQQVLVHYAKYLPVLDRDEPPIGHIITSMCQLAGVTGEIARKPYFWLAEDEKRKGSLVSRQVAIQSSGLGARLPMLNKQWYLERWQTVVAALRSQFDVVQVGSAGDPALEGVIDRRNIPIAETAAILSQSRLYIGQVGFLMHLARAVECRSVIVYGGRETPELTGYSGNENLYTALPCAPCWRWNTCDYDRKCMQLITPDMVMAAVEKQASRYGTPLPVDRDVIPQAA